MLGWVILFLLSLVLLDALNEPYAKSTIAENTRRFFSVFLTAELYRNILQTLYRFFVGFGLAVSIGAITGLAMGRLKMVESILSPPVHALRPIPSAAVVPLAILLFRGNTGDLMKIVVIFYGVFWPVLIQVYQGCKDIDERMVESGRTLGKSRWAIFTGVILPASFPAIMTGARVGLAIGLLLAVTVEIIATGETFGLGYLIIDYERSFKWPQMLGVIVMVGVIGWVLDFVFRYIEKSVLSWHHGRASSGVEFS